MRKLFVTATGTDIGKTHLVELACRQARAAGKSLTVLKPLVSGVDEADLAHADTGRLLTASGQVITAETADRISPWRFKAPLAPDRAAARENRTVTLTEILAFCRDSFDRSTTDIGVIEGVGGVMAPITRDHTMLDWMAAMEWPVLLVTGTYLGTLSHTFTALEVLRARNLSVNGVILNETPGSTVGVPETAASLARFCPGVPLVPLAYDPDGNAPAPDLMGLFG